MHYLVQALIPGSRAHRLLGAYTHAGENYENAKRSLKIWQKTPVAGYGRDDEQDVKQGKGERLKALMSFLRAEVKAQHRIHFSRIGLGKNNPKPNFPSRPLHLNKNGPTEAHLMVSKSKYSKGSFLTTNYERKTKCIFCDKMGHENWKCFKIVRRTREEQLKKMSDAGGCFKCLKLNHLRAHCRTKIICQNCGGPHYLIFCRGNNSRRDSISENGRSSKERTKLFSTKPKVHRSAHTALFIRITFNDRTWVRDLDNKGVTIIRRENVETSKIDLLLGADNLSKIWTDQVVYLEDGLTAINTKIGWSIFGEISLKEEGCDSIPSNFNIAQKRLERCVNKLTTQKRLEDYSKIFTEWEQENIIERIHDDNKDVGQYLSHRPVFKETNKTTPIRPVYDSSCSTVKGMSLNDIFKAGPNSVAYIPNILIRFRENKIGISADIRKAFQMIEVNPEDRKYLKFIWRNIGSNVLTFQHTRVVFGLTSSPFTLRAVIEHLLKSIIDENYYVAQRLLRSFYVDICLTSLNKEFDVVDFKEKASEIINRAGMELCQWETTETSNLRDGNYTCVICRRYSAKPGSVEAAPLPTSRIHLGKPFQVTGIDLFRPLLLRNNMKTWVALFTFGVYRAVHMGVIQGLDTPSFLMTLRQFISRRGRPLVIYSDNGTNFARTNKLLSHIDWNQMQNYSSAQKITWWFNPSVSPWWGGFWERFIRIIKDSDMPFEAIVNEIPLTYMSEDPDKFRPLTPAMFLQFNDENTFPELDRICELVQKKEDSATRAITGGEVVYVGNNSQKRINWLLGLVKKVYPGEDGNCRVAKVRIKSGEIVQPIQRLYPLEIHSSDMEAYGVQNLSLNPSNLNNNKKMNKQIEKDVEKELY
ncbi:hypothetical protein LAZ67_16001020 [Cordylochernes scorpioides]|uniref:Integrase catalytic domain-containing protein n=1 Tax=Cordylochernes scorpioides TaxID=51811 RepID=A0ABY6LB16_9ARAC|nr:hypothetical protein LAZ67_16001020 [Cordylochernes scorpioides]